MRIPDFVLDSTAQDMLKELKKLVKSSDTKLTQLVDQAKKDAKDTDRYRKDFESDREDLYKATLDIAKAVREASGRSPGSTNPRSGAAPGLNAGAVSPQLRRLATQAADSGNNIAQLGEDAAAGAGGLGELGNASGAASEQLDRYNATSARGELVAVKLYNTMSILTTSVIGLAGSLGTGIIVIAKRFMLLGNTLNELAVKGTAFGDSVGQGGMTATEALTSLQLSGLDAAGILTDYSSVVQTMGKKSFTTMVDGFMEATNYGADLGMSMEHAADGLGKEMQKRQQMGLLDDINQAKTQKQITTTIKRQQAYATALGASTAELAAFTQSLLERTPVLSASLLRLNSELRGTVIAGITDFGTAMMAMGGEEGARIAEAFTEAAASGAMGFSDTMTGYITALPSLAGPMNKYITAIQRGSLSQDDANQMAQDLTMQLGNLSESEKNRIFALARAGDAQANSMAKAIMQFEQSKKKLADINKQLGKGLTMEEVQKGTNVLQSIINKISGSFEAFKTAFLAGLGKAGPGLETLSESLEKARNTIFTALGALAAKFGKASKGLEGFADVSGSLGEKLGEQLPDIIEYLTDKIVGFISYIPTMIDSMKSFISGFKSVMTVLGAAISPVIAVIKLLIPVVKVLSGALSILILPIKLLAWVSEKLSDMITSVAKMFGFVKEGGNDLAYGLGQLGGVVTVVYGAMKLFGIGVPKLLVSLGKTLATGASKAVGALGGAFQKAAPGLSDKISSSVGRITDRIRGRSSFVGPPRPPSDGLQQADTAAKSTKGIADIIQSAGKTIKTVLTDLSAGVKNLITNLANGIKNGLTALSEGIANVGKNIGKAVGGLIQGTLEGVGKGLAALGKPRAILGAATLGLLAGTMFLAAKSFQAFAEVSWSDIGKGFVALLGLGAVSVVLGLALPLIIPGAIAIGALGLALIPFAAAANIAAPAMEQLMGGLALIKDVPITTLLGLGPALAGIALGLAAFSAGGLVGGVLDSLGGLFGADSPFEELAKIGDAAPGIVLLSEKMGSFGTTVSHFNDAIDNIDGDAAAAQLLAIAAGFTALSESINKISMVDLLKLSALRFTTPQTLNSNEQPLLEDSQSPTPRANSALALSVTRNRKSLTGASTDTAAQQILAKDASPRGIIPNEVPKPAFLQREETPTTPANSQPLMPQANNDLLEEMIKEQRLTNRLLRQGNSTARDLADML
jgi:hypothetical protein